MREERQEGAMSVYFALMIGVLIALVLMMIENARMSAIRLELECAVDLGFCSLLSEYNRELLRQYDILMIDTAYEEKTGSLDHLMEHLEEYLQYELEPSDGLVLMPTKDLYGLSLCSIEHGESGESGGSMEVTRVSRATDDNGAVFRYMAISYMLEHYGYTYATDLADLCETSESFSGSDIFKENEDAQTAIDSIEIPQPAEGEEPSEWTEAEIENPTDAVNGVRSLGVLPVVCKKEISTQCIDPSIYASSRCLVEGDGMCEAWEEVDPLMGELLFTEYIMDHCGCYTTPKENGFLQYELEYLIVGKDSDSENLKEIANRLLLIRGAANTTYFFSDAELCAQAKAMASSLAVVLSFPEFEVIFEAAIIAAWIYAESLVDVRQLMEGKRVPLMKSPGQWNLSLENALSLSAESVGNDASTSETADTSIGLTYKEYLRLLLYPVDSDTKTKRMMNVVEMDIRKLEGYEYFCLDNCIAAATFQFIFESSYGYTIFMEREMKYM